MFSFTRLHNMPWRIHSCLSYLDFREGNCLSHKTNFVEEQEISYMYKTYGELSTTCHHFDYRPLVIARFQRDEISLVFARFCSNFHWLYSIIVPFKRYLIIDVKSLPHKQRWSFTRLLIFKIKFSSEPPTRWLTGSAEMTPVIGSARGVCGEVTLTIELVD